MGNIVLKGDSSDRGELEEMSNMQILHNTLSKYRPVKVYTLDVIISVGYRVKSFRGTQFRRLFDAYVFATDLIRSARQSVILIDNYVDESVLLMLAKRHDGVLEAGPYQAQLPVSSDNADRKEKYPRPLSDRG